MNLLATPKPIPTTYLSVEQAPGVEGSPARVMGARVTAASATAAQARAGEATAARAMEVKGTADVSPGEQGWVGQVREEESPGQGWEV
ncbi:hypothetical protein HXX76_015612 [Chlamydomonas incerta]|uniref:Uncharacterized protein n=1 Tax=Chlamydomonas incerta TaxID=51695 RepID=A0A835VRN2_CHLIN|nr:hypothetical protein HXX76_015612 [Chlamydomonas incerta]|eukprot:KAG2423014.1 hypothetical protein HXX76_015612 [Chlamydomonas incerta]